MNSQLLDYYSTTTSKARRPKKKRKVVKSFAPILLGQLNTRLGKPQIEDVKILLDSGSSSSLATYKLAKKLRLKPGTVTTWNTAAGDFTTSEHCEATFKLTELNPTGTIQCDLHVAPSLGAYDMIIGRDVLTELGIDLKFSNRTIQWGESIAPMKDSSLSKEELQKSFYIRDPDGIDDSLDQMNIASNMKQILAAKYDKANLKEVVEDTTTLNAEEKAKLLEILTKHESMFDGTLGRWKGLSYDIELKEGAKPYHGRPYSVPKAYEQQLKDEVERLCKVGVLKKVNRSEWAAPTFVIPKKDQTIRFISDFRELNKRIKRKPYPIPKIQDLLLKLEGFSYATALDLNMGYYHIELSPKSKTLCTIVLPWGKYEYQKLPMGLCNSPDIFQEKMSELFMDLEYVRAYIDDLLVLTNGDWDDHLEKLDEVLTRLERAGLKVNARKSFFGRHELEYLGYWITRTGVQPMPKKVDAILDIAPPKTKRELRSFIGMVNYYRDMWIRRSELLAPLSALCSKNAKWQWTDVEQTAFEKIKRVISKETLLAYPDFNDTFEIHTDASDYQLGAVISQKGRPIAFYSRKLQDAQTRYTTTERELLAIVETLKEFKNILLGQKIKVYTDHKNLTYKNFNVDRVIRWRMVLEEYNPELIYIPGKKNIVADALSRLDKNEPPKFTDKKHELLLMAHHLATSSATPKQRTNVEYAEAFGTEDDEVTEYPLSYKIIQREQQKDKEFLREIEKSSGNYIVKSFHGGGKHRQLICLNGKIVIPPSLQKRVIEHYHALLCHPGESRMELTIKQHFTWKNIREDIRSFCKTCHICQTTKRHKKKYGHLPPKVAESEPWETLCVDLIGPYKIPRNNKPDLCLWCVTMIDPATGWFEMKQIETKRADIVANVVEQTWFTRYPWPTQVILDRGTEFMAEFATMIKEDYGIRRKPITTRNPQANSILERVHQTIGNMIRTFRAQEAELDEDDPWSGILSATMFAIRSTVHTTNMATPTQLVFGRDSMLNVIHEANWRYIKERKQKFININNKKENAKRIPHDYTVGDTVMIKQQSNIKYGTDAYSGPHTVVEVRNNGTLRIKTGVLTDTYNIRNVQPYYK